ncbi:MAG TPA: DUF2156 domain-containing protein [Actinophytocola sp.]|nr:DUF2156 domain-containing protein [Actinophytocola sp.]
MAQQAVSPPPRLRLPKVISAGVGVTAARLWHRVPFTTVVVVVMLVAAVASGALWTSAPEHSWYSSVAYGLPAFEAGKWWTVVTGAFFAMNPLYYIPVAGGFALLVGLAEWRLGTRRTIVVTVLGQVVAVFGAALALFLLRDTGWAWAERLAPQTDLGFSAGALVAVVVVAAAVRPPWRLRLRAAVCVYAGVSILYVGTLADLEHAVAVAVALPLSRRLAGPARSTTAAHPNRREWRLLAVTGLVVAAVIQVVVRISPSDGPLGSTVGQSGSMVELAIVLVVVALLVNGLRKGRRVAWRWAVALSGLYVAFGVALALFAFVTAVLGVDLTVGRLPFIIAEGALWTAVLAVLVLGSGAFRVPSRRHRKRATGTGDVPAATELLERHGGSTLSWMTTWPDNAHFFTSDGESFIAYRRHAGMAIALGDPVGPPGTMTRTIAEFTAMCDHIGLKPCLFSVTGKGVAATNALGWLHVQVAEDTLVDLAELEFRGKSWQSVRSALNRGVKEGVEFRLLTLADQSWTLVNQVRSVSEEWVGDKGMPEMGFTLGGVDEALDPRTRVGIAFGADGSVQGVTSWLPVYSGANGVEGWTLDVMRRRTDGFRPVMEYLIASSCLAFQADGARFVSLSGAPLARAPDASPAAPLERLLDAFGGAMEPYYGFRSLHSFKTKFKPRYEPMYLAYRDEADLPRVGVALARAYLPDTSLRALARLRSS